MAGKQKTDKDPVAASEHLGYEIDMFFHTGALLVSKEYSGGDGGVLFPTTSIHFALDENKVALIRNALIESFLIHARSLVDFFYRDNPWEDDLIAEQYIEGWKDIRPSIPEQLATLRRRVGKEIAHLTSVRTEDGKPWPYQALAKEMLGLISPFMEKVPDEMLSQDWQQRRLVLGV